MRTLFSVGFFGLIASLFHPNAMAGPREPEEIYSSVMHGSFDMFGNSMRIDSSGYPNADVDGVQDLEFDGNLDGQDDTWESSASTLNLPAGAVVKYAQLNWWESDNESLANFTPDKRGQMLLRTPDGVYHQMHAEIADLDTYNATFQWNHYRTNITSLITTGGNGEYLAANISVESFQTSSNFENVWSITIFYELNSEPLRSFRLFEGAKPFASSTSYAEVAINDFLTPATGSVTGALGVALFGCSPTPSSQGQYSIDNGLSWNSLSDAANPANAICNSRYSVFDSNIGLVHIDSKGDEVNPMNIVSKTKAKANIGKTIGQVVGCEIVNTGIAFAA